jgi:ribose transport system substrate-binding protein
MSRKKLAAVLGVMLLAVAALTATSTAQVDKTGATAKPARTSGGELRIAVILAALDNDFYVAQRAGVLAQAKKHPNVSVTVQAGRQRTAFTEVVSLIEDAITKQVDAIAVNGSDTKPLMPVLRRVIKAKIPLVLFDAPAPGLKGVATYVGTDNFAGGLADGKWLRKKLPRGGEVGVLLCVPGHPVTRARLNGFKQGAGRSFKIVSSLDALCTRDGGRKAMEDMITAHPDIKIVFSTSDTQSLGAIRALEAARLDPVFVSFDAQADVVKNIRAGGVMDASAGWSAKTLGSMALARAVAAARGQKLPKQTVVPVTVVDKTNARTWKG